MGGGIIICHSVPIISQKSCLKATQARLESAVARAEAAAARVEACAVAVEAHVATLQASFEALPSGARAISVYSSSSLFGHVGCRVRSIARTSEALLRRRVLRRPAAPRRFRTLAQIAQAVSPQ
jgi:hypothetical protein